VDHQDEPILHYGDGPALPGGGVTTSVDGTAISDDGMLDTGCRTSFWLN